MSSVRYAKIANDTWERPAVRAGCGNISDGQAALGRLWVTAGGGYFTTVEKREAMSRSWEIEHHIGSRGLFRAQ